MSVCLYGAISISKRTFFFASSPPLPDFSSLGHELKVIASKVMSQHIGVRRSTAMNNTQHKR